MRALVMVSAFTALLIFINYQYDLDGQIRNKPLPVKLIAWYWVFAVAFAVPYIFLRKNLKITGTNKNRFLFLLFLAPAIFSLKLSFSIPVHFSDNADWNNYWNHIFYWPVLVVVTGGILYFIWKLFDRQQVFYGIRSKDIDWKPYFLMLIMMIPLIALASVQKDFLAVYPRLRAIEGVFNDDSITWWHKLLFELSYGTDFITIELFFRGFLVLAFIKWAGRDAILPMACFYCAIHFGKPAGECISSYFGGILLGIVVFNTRSILGGLLVHLGIAWMMEAGGYIGNSI